MTTNETSEGRMAAAQRRDVVAATRQLLADENAVMLCDVCGVPLEGFRSCYCLRCEMELYADMEEMRDAR